MTRRRILLAGMFHETHTFVSEITMLADFEIRRGSELLARRDSDDRVRLEGGLWARP